MVEKKVFDIEEVLMFAGSVNQEKWELIDYAEDLPVIRVKTDGSGEFLMEFIGLLLISEEVAERDFGSNLEFVGCMLDKMDRAAVAMRAFVKVARKQLREAEIKAVEEETEGQAVEYHH